jgi:hypothetical protein
MVFIHHLSSLSPSVFHRNFFAKAEATGTSVTGLQQVQVMTSYVNLIGRSSCEGCIRISTHVLECEFSRPIQRVSLFIKKLVFQKFVE